MTAAPRERRFAPGAGSLLRRVAWCEPFWVLALAPALLLPPRFLPGSLQLYQAAARPLLVALLFLGWPLRDLAYGRLSARTPLDWPLALLICWLPVNYWASADKALSWEALGYLAFGLALYFALLNWPPARSRPALIAALLLALGAGLALAAPLLTALDPGKIFHLPLLDPLLKGLAGRLPGNVNANRTAGTFILVLPLYAALALRPGWARRPWLPALAGLAAALMLAELFLAQSRGAYVAASAALGLVFLLRWPRLAFALPLLLAPAAWLTLAGRWPWLLGLVLNRAGMAGVGGLDSRVELWSRAVYALQDFPFTGIGIGTFQRVIPLLYPLFLTGPNTLITHAHNLFLQVGLDLGLPGLLAYCAVILNTFVMLGQALRRRIAPLTWALAAGTAGGLLAMLVQGLVDAAVWGSKPAFIPWLLIALAAQLYLRTARAEEAAPDERIDLRAAQGFDA